MRHAQCTLPFRATLTSHHATARVSISGDLDLSTRDRLTRGVRLALRRDVALLALDLRGVSFIDAAGLGAVIQALHDSREARVECELWPSSSVRRILDLLGVVPSDVGRPLISHRHVERKRMSIWDDAFGTPEGFPCASGSAQTRRDTI